MTPIDLVVEEHFHRAAPGGMGGTKAAGNYSPVSCTCNPKFGIQALLTQHCCGMAALQHIVCSTVNYVCNKTQSKGNLGVRTMPLVTDQCVLAAVV